MITTPYENLFSTIWYYTHGYIILIMTLVLVMVIAIMMYEWFRPE